MQNNELRKEIRLLKALQNITYAEIASYLSISRNSLYNWLNNQYDFGDEKLLQLNEIITNLKEY